MNMSYADQNDAADALFAAARDCSLGSRTGFSMLKHAARRFASTEIESATAASDVLAAHGVDWPTVLHINS